MTFPTLSRLVNSSSPFLPACIRSIVQLWHTRTALDQKRFNDADALAQRSGALLRGDDGAAMNDECTRAMHASQSIMLAISRRGAGDRPMEAEQSFVEADGLFKSLLGTDPIGASVLACDYLTMLTEYDATEEIEAFSRRYLSPDGEAASLRGPLDCVAVMIAPIPRMFLHLEKRLLERQGMEAAKRSLTYSAGLAMACGDYATASLAVERILGHEPEDRDAHRLRGLLRLNAGEIEGAKEDFSACIRADADDIEAHAALGYIRLENGSPGEAIEVAESVLAKRANHADALYLRGESRRRLGDAKEGKQNSKEAEDIWNAAFNDLTAAVDQRAEAPFYRARAVVCLRLQNAAQALEDLNQAASMEAEDAEARGWRAAVLLALKRNDEALTAASIGLSLLESAGPDDGTKSWLLTLKGKSLLSTSWSEQAIDAFWSAVEICPGNEEPAALLIQCYRERREWPELAAAAERLQGYNYGAALKRELRICEVKALRQAGKLMEAFRAMERRPAPACYEFAWVSARVFSDTGDFESAHKCLSEHEPGPEGDGFDRILGRRSERFDHVSMLGWVLQNLEPRDREERQDLAIRGCRLYEEAMELKTRPKGDAGSAPVQKDETLVWVKKGIANAKLRGEAQSEAEKLYQEIIDDCQQLIQKSNRNALTFALIGWCQHCLKRPEAAARFYQAAIDNGQDSIPVLFDYSLVLTAYREDGNHGALASYKSTAIKARESDALNRIGACRVAIRDLRELLFRSPAIAEAGKIVQMLCMEIVDAISSNPHLPDSYVAHIEQFLSTCILNPVPLVEHEYEAISSRIRYASLVRRGDLGGAAKEAEKAARLYGELKEHEWESASWSDAAFCHSKLGAHEHAYMASARALEAGLYSFNKPVAFEMIQQLASGAAGGQISMEHFRLVMETVFRRVGPARAYLDGAAIVRAMSAEEHDLFAQTVVDLFPPVKYDEVRLYLDESADGAHVPNDDQVLAPFLIYLTPFMNASSAWEGVEVS